MKLIYCHSSLLISGLLLPSIFCPPGSRLTESSQKSLMDMMRKPAFCSVSEKENNIIYPGKQELTEENTGLKIRITETTEQGISCFRVETASATYIYDKEGGGFISMTDKDQADWISFRNVEYPYPGNAASKFRGIPNLVNNGPDKGTGHPGFDKCTSRFIPPNIIETVSKSGLWKFRWVFHDSYARFTMIRVQDGVNYWFLYEGTPAGKYDPEKMYWGNNTDGRMDNFPDLSGKTGIYSNWNWVYMGQSAYPRILFIKQVEPDDKTDLFSYMGSQSGKAENATDGMVCFGFGRAPSTKPVLNSVNLEFIIGFVDKEVTGHNSHKMIENIINSYK